MKKKIILLVVSAFFFLLLSYSTNPTWAKYVLEENMLVATVQIDRTAPNVEVDYSPKEKTTEKVEVTITADEPVEEPDGWTLQKDGHTLKKEYEKNTKEEVEIKDKAGNIKKVTIEVNNIDTKAPTVEIEKIINSNTAYPNYANQEAQIEVNIVVKDNQKIVKPLQKEDIQILINQVKINPSKKVIEVTKNTDTEKKIKLTISGILEEGNLTIKIPKGIVKDEANNTNLAVEKNTNIQIDNTKPKASYSQESIENGKIEANITANETIRQLEGWNLNNHTTLTKVFRNNVSYSTTVYDLAGNSANVNIQVTRANNIIMSYGSYNSNVGWSIGYGKDDIAGIEAVRQNPKYKSESVAFSIYGDLDKDYLQGRAYVYSHWGENSTAICEYSNKEYAYGWNPSETGWRYRKEENTVTLPDERDYFQFGGADINKVGKTDSNGNNQIPSNVASEFRYGISALQLKLKSYEENAICYQVYVDSVGWLNPAKNGEITCYDFTKPISALRVALIPISEMSALLNTWQQDVRKNHSLKTEK